MRQLVYRHEFHEAFHVLDSSGAEFQLLGSPRDAFRFSRSLVSCFGLPGFLKVALKQASSRRRLYCIFADGAVAHYGWVSFSFCRFYKVQAGDVVIGPIWTDDRFRGRGYATLALMRTINELMQKGSHVFWIDTSEDNVACQKVIEKCGFGQKVSVFEKQ